jgi:hypothetical protein
VACHQRLAATTAQTASTSPKGHAPCKKPYADPRRQDPANARTNQGLRFSREYVTSIAVTATSPKIVKRSIGLSSVL